MTLVILLLAILHFNSWIATTSDNTLPRLCIQWFEISCIGGINSIAYTDMLNLASESNQLFDYKHLTLLIIITTYIHSVNILV